MLDVIDMCGWMRKEVVKRRKNPGSGTLLIVGGWAGAWTQDGPAHAHTGATVRRVLERNWKRTIHKVMRSVEKPHIIYHGGDRLGWLAERSREWIEVRVPFIGLHKYLGKFNRVYNSSRPSKKEKRTAPNQSF